MGPIDCPFDWGFALHNLAFDLCGLFGQLLTLTTITPAPKSLLRLGWLLAQTFSQVSEGGPGWSLLPLLTWTLNLGSCRNKQLLSSLGIVLALLINTKGLKLENYWRSVYSLSLSPFLNLYHYF